MQNTQDSFDTPMAQAGCGDCPAVWGHFPDPGIRLGNATPRLLPARASAARRQRRIRGKSVKWEA